MKGTGTGKKERLDVILVERGLAPSREQAKRLIMAGEVMVGDRVATTIGETLKPEQAAAVVVKNPPRFVGRGGLKMEGALEHFGIDVTGMLAMDIGASTGGFTDCLLQRGASHIYAYDVGTNQMAWKLRSDARVKLREKFNMRRFQAKDIPGPVDMIVADVSFISLTYVLPPAFCALNVGGHGVVLIKPQFELQPGDIGPGGIVRDAALHERACAKIEAFIRSQPDMEWRGLVESCLQGHDGNREFFGWFTKTKASPANGAG
jgi:23S rRNA (cytidine1920-2'-O)/16S rRNA (cytidine1409-2'-O)-methyltransferase